MIIDLVKIGNVKTLNELKEYPLNEAYFYNNYLFHYLIITNNTDNGIKDLLEMYASGCGNVLFLCMSFRYLLGL